MNYKKLESKADSIPSMTGSYMKNELQKYAGNVPYNSCIVEVGVWLGASTAYMALGLLKQNRTDVSIHCFDRFTASRSEVRKARTLNGKPIHLRCKQNTSGHMILNLALFPVELHVHRQHSSTIKWESIQEDRKIGLYVDDACKGKGSFSKMILELSPFWIIGETMLILMDYDWLLQHGNDGQFSIIEGEFHGSFELEERVMMTYKGKSTSVPIFRYVKELDYGSLAE